MEILSDQDLVEASARIDFGEHRHRLSDLLALDVYESFRIAFAAVKAYKRLLREAIGLLRDLEVKLDRERDVNRRLRDQIVRLERRPAA